MCSPERLYPPAELAPPGRSDAAPPPPPPLPLPLPARANASGSSRRSRRGAAPIAPDGDEASGHAERLEAMGCEFDSIEQAQDRVKQNLAEHGKLREQLLKLQSMKAHTQKGAQMLRRKEKAVMDQMEALLKSGGAELRSCPAAANASDVSALRSALREAVLSDDPEQARALGTMLSRNGRDEANS